MAIDRNQYKPVEVAAIKKIADEQDKSQYAKLEFHQLVAGVNEYKIFPAHISGNPFVEMSVMSWLPFVKNDGTEGKKSIFDARFHSTYGKDLVNEYCNMANLYLESLGTDEANSKLNILRDGMTSIRSVAKYIMYALDINTQKVALLSVNKGIRDAMYNDMVNNAKYFNGNDCFTDLDNGFPVIITYTPKAVPATNTYRYSRGPVAYRISDEALEIFANKPSLKDLYYNQYKITDMQAQVFGISAFDERNKIGLIKTEQWRAKADEIFALFGTNMAQLSGKPEVVIEKPAVTQVGLGNGLNSLPNEINVFIGKPQTTDTLLEGVFDEEEEGVDMLDIRAALKS